jgi:hypothetical protein
MSARILFFSFIYFTVAVSAAESEYVARLMSPKGVLNEALADEVPVSGRVVVGVELEGLRDVVDFSILASPRFGGQSFCLRMLSREGRYWSENTFQFPKNSPSGPIGLEYESKYQEYLSGLAATDLGLMAFAGGCASKGEGEVFPMMRKSAELKEPRLVVYVNSGRTDTFASVQAGGATTSPEPCTKLRKGRRTGFDTVCTLNLPQVDTDDEHVDVRLFRRKYEQILPPIDLVVLTTP